MFECGKDSDVIALSAISSDQTSVRRAKVTIINQERATVIDL